MSISTLQEKIFNKGCFTAGIVVVAFAMVVSMFTRGGGSSRDVGSEGGPDAVVTVGNIPVPAALFQAKASELAGQAVRDQATQMKVDPATLGSPDAPTQAAALVRATGQIIQQAAVQALATKAPVTEDEIRSVAAAAVAQDTGSLKESLVQTGKVKSSATGVEVEKALADDLLAQFRDPTKKASVVERIAGPVLVQRLGAQAAGSDQALRDSYKSFVVRRVFFSATSGSKETPEARAAKAEADLKAGKPFTAVMDAYSNDPPSAGKKVHDLTEVKTMEAVDSQPELAGLKGKAANATTGVVDVPGGKAIYQLVAVNDALPKDFDKNKAALRAARVQSLGQREIEKRVKAFVASDAVKWKSPGFKAVAAAAEPTSMMSMLDPSAMKRATDVALAALKAESASDRRLAAQALLVITAGTVENRKTALEAALANGIEDAALSVELAGLYGDAKNGAKATDTLIAASKANDDYGVRGQRVFGDIAAKAIDLQKRGVLTKDQLTAVQTQQAVWAAARTENEKLATEAKTEAAKEKAANEAELARQRAEAAKAGTTGGADEATKKANEAELARQKAQAAPAKPSGGR